MNREELVNNIVGGQRDSRVEREKKRKGGNKI